MIRPNRSCIFITPRIAQYLNLTMKHIRNTLVNHHRKVLILSVGAFFFDVSCKSVIKNTSRGHVTSSPQVKLYDWTAEETEGLFIYLIHH